MEEAGTTDLRAQEDLPLALEILGTPKDAALADAVAKLRAWLAAGGQRRDRDNDKAYEHADAIRILDAWWPLWLKAEFAPRLGKRAVRPAGRDLHVLQRPQQPRRPPRLGLAGRLVRLRLQGPRAVLGPQASRRATRCATAATAGARVPRGAALLARRRRSPCRRPRSTRATPRARGRPVVLGLGPLPPARRRHPAADPVDQPPDLPAGRRGAVTPLGPRHGQAVSNDQRSGWASFLPNQSRTPAVTSAV